MVQDRYMFIFHIDEFSITNSLIKHSLKRVYNGVQILLPLARLVTLIRRSSIVASSGDSLLMATHPMILLSSSAQTNSSL